MMEVWNELDLKPPPFITLPCSRTNIPEALMVSLQDALNDVQTAIHNLSDSLTHRQLDDEVFIIARMIYRYNNNLGGHRAIQGLKKVKKCLERLQHINMAELLKPLKEDLTMILSVATSSVVYIQSALCLKYLLHRLMGSCMLLGQTALYSMHTFIHAYEELASGCYIPNMLVFMALLSRIRVLSLRLQQQMLPCYGHAYKLLLYVYTVEPEDNLPKNLETWLTDQGICLSLTPHIERKMVKSSKDLDVFLSKYCSKPSDAKYTEMMDTLDVSVTWNMEETEPSDMQLKIKQELPMTSAENSSSSVTIKQPEPSQEADTVHVCDVKPEAGVIHVDSKMDEDLGVEVARQDSPESASTEEGRDEEMSGPKSSHSLDGDCNQERTQPRQTYIGLELEKNDMLERISSVRQIRGALFNLGKYTSCDMLLALLRSVKDIIPEERKKHHKGLIYELYKKSVSPRDERTNLREITGKIERFLSGINCALRQKNLKQLKLCDDLEESAQSAERKAKFREIIQMCAKAMQDFDRGQQDAKFHWKKRQLRSLVKSVENGSKEFDSEQYEELLHSVGDMGKSGYSHIKLKHLIPSFMQNLLNWCIMKISEVDIDQLFATIKLSKIVWRQMQSVEVIALKRFPERYRQLRNELSPIDGIYVLTKAEFKSCTDFMLKLEKFDAHHRQMGEEVGNPLEHLEVRKDERIESSLPMILNCPYDTGCQVDFDKVLEMKQESQSEAETTEQNMPRSLPEVEQIELGIVVPVDEQIEQKAIGMLSLLAQNGQNDLSPVDMQLVDPDVPKPLTSVLLINEMPECSELSSNADNLTAPQSSIVEAGVSDNYDADKLTAPQSSMVEAGVSDNYDADLSERQHEIKMTVNRIHNYITELKKCPAKQIDRVLENIQCDIPNDQMKHFCTTRRQLATAVERKGKGKKSFVGPRKNMMYLMLRIVQKLEEKLPAQCRTTLPKIMNESEHATKYRYVLEQIKNAKIMVQCFEPKNSVSTQRRQLSALLRELHKKTKLVHNNVYRSAQTSVGELGNAIDTLICTDPQQNILKFLDDTKRHCENEIAQIARDTSHMAVVRRKKHVRYVLKEIRKKPKCKDVMLHLHSIPEVTAEYFPEEYKKLIKKLHAEEKVYALNNETHMLVVKFLLKLKTQCSKHQREQGNTATGENVASEKATMKMSNQDKKSCDSKLLNTASSDTQTDEINMSCASQNASSSKTFPKNASSPTGNRKRKNLTCNSFANDAKKQKSPLRKSKAGTTSSKAHYDLRSHAAEKANTGKFIPPVLVITTCINDHFKKTLRNNKKFRNLPAKLDRNNQTFTYFGKEIKLSLKQMSTITELCNKQKLAKITDKSILEPAVTEVTNVFKTWI